MKTIGFLKKLFLLATLLMSGAAWAQVATLVELKGAAQAIPAVGTPRDLRQGDSINQGETVATKAMTSAVIRFEDGQVVALTQNSRFAITNYTYNKMEPAKSNVLFTLLDGGMRAVTGLIGKAKPDNVTYKAANATIGIRGTDVTIGVTGGNLVIQLNSGKLSFSFGGQSYSMTAGQGTYVPAGATSAIVMSSEDFHRIWRDSKNVPPALLGAIQNLATMGDNAAFRNTTISGTNNVGQVESQRSSTGGLSNTFRGSGSGSGSGGGSNNCPNGQPRPNPPSTC